MFVWVLYHRYLGAIQVFSRGKEPHDFFSLCLGRSGMEFGEENCFLDFTSQ